MQLNFSEEQVINLKRNELSDSLAKEVARLANSADNTGNCISTSKVKNHLHKWIIKKDFNKETLVGYHSELS